MPEIHPILLAIVAAFGVSAAVFLVSIRQRRAWVAPLALGAGFLVGYVLLNGALPFPPREAAHRLAYLVLTGTVLGIGDALASRVSLARIGIHLALFLGAWVFLLPGVRAEPPTVSVQEVGGLAVAALVFWLVLETWFRLENRFLPPLILMAVAAGTAMLLALSHNGLLGLLAGVVAATLGPAMILACFRSDPVLGRGAALPLTMALGGLWIAARHFSASEVSPLALGLLATVPALALAARVATGSTWRSLPVRLLLPLAPVAAVIALTLPALPSDDDELDYSTIPTPPPITAAPPPVTPPTLPTTTPARDDDNPFRRFTDNVPGK